MEFQVINASKLKDYDGPVLVPVQGDISGYPEYVLMERKAEKQRTLTQNRAIHKYCSMLAKALNEAGWDMRRVIKEEFDIPWTEESAKENIWRPVQVSLFNKESTTALERQEVSQVYEVINRNISEKTGVYVPFPTRHGV